MPPRSPAGRTSKSGRGRKAARLRAKTRVPEAGYLNLIREFPLASIRNERQLRKAQGFVDRLLRSPLSDGAEQYLGVLSDLIAVYEDAHCEFPSVSTADLLAHLIEVKGVSQGNVHRGTGIPRSTISEILSGARQLSLGHIEPLANYFNVPRSVFLTDDAVGKV